MPRINFTEDKPIIMSIGGSLIVPGEMPDAAFLSSVKELVKKQSEQGRKLIIVAGGGKTCRNYNDAARAANPKVTNDDLDWLGIETTKLNGLLLKTVLGDLAHSAVIKKPIDKPVEWERGALIVSGWEPGASSDRVICLLAKLHGATSVINVSNIDHVYAEDPRKNPDAKAFDEMSWKDYRAMVGDEWDPGLSAPFDPIASKICDESGMSVAIVNGNDAENIENLMNGEDFVGTILS